jgi:hypothetical protein
MNKTGKKTKTDWYLLGAILPLSIFPFAILILPGSRMGSFIPIFMLIVPSVIGIASCVQGFRRSSSGMTQTAFLVFGMLYLIPFLILSFLLSGPLQD